MTRPIFCLSRLLTFLVPNQHIGIFKVGFMPQWIAREYLSRRGSAKFQPHQLKPSRSPLLGYSLDREKVDGEYIPKELPEVNRRVRKDLMQEPKCSLPSSRKSLRNFSPQRWIHWAGASLKRVCMIEPSRSIWTLFP